MLDVSPTNRSAIVDFEMNQSSTSANNSNSYYGYDDVSDIIHNQFVQALFCILYTMIFVLGVFGNVLVCYVVGRNRAMQTVTNLFISNLALSDILLCVLCVPFTPLYTFLGTWIFGSELCHAVVFSQGTSVYISTLTLTSIAVDRFFVIVYPFKPRMKLGTCGAIIMCIWLLSIVVTLPYGIYTVLRSEGEAFYCEENWPSERVRQVYGAMTAALQFLLPFVVVAFCYIKVSLKLNDRARAKPGSKSSRKEEADRERKRRTNHMLIAMVGIFGVSWMPLTIINLVNDVYVSIATWEYFNLCFFLVHALAMSSTCYNPFLYAWLNENFRKEFKQVIPCFDRSSTGGQSDSAGRGEASMGGRGAVSGRSCGVGGWKVERTCNGNETLETLETLLPSTSARCRSSSLRPPGYSSTADEERDGTYNPVASYTARDDEVQLHIDGPDLLTGVLGESL